jgi:hypothetical protein
MLDHHRGGRGLGLPGEVGTGDAFAVDDMDVRVVALDGRRESLEALAGHLEVGLVVDDADVAAAAERVGHQVRGDDAVADVVGRHRGHVVASGHHVLRHVVHEHELHAGGRRLPVGARGGDGVGRDGDDDVRSPREHGFDVGNLPVGFEAGVGDGDDVDAQLAELLAETGDLGVRPAVAGVVHDDRGGGLLRPHLLGIGGRERHRVGLRRGLAVGAGG